MMCFTKKGGGGSEGDRIPKSPSEVWYYLFFCAGDHFCCFQKDNEFIQLSTRITMLSCIGALSVIARARARAPVFPCRCRVDVCSCDTLFDTKQTSYYIFKGPLK